MYKTLQKAQPRALQIIENSFKNDRLSHAYLFTGPNGSYKKEMAYHLAMMLYCKESKPCYNCPTCTQILENRHMNVYYIEPFGQTIKKEQIIALQEEFSKTSLLEGPRIYIINEAHTMSSSAANSLLKFIEEPNPGVYGILITEHKENILSTIISRSMVISFDELDKNLLRENLGQEDSIYLNAVCYLTSNLEEAKDYLINDSFNKVVDLIKDFAIKLANEEHLGLFYKMNQDVFTNKENTKMFLILLEAYFRDIFEYQVSEKVLTFTNLVDEVSKTSTLYHKNDILKYLFMLLDLIKKTNNNVNMSLLFNQFLIELRGGI